MAKAATTTAFWSEIRRWGTRRRPGCNGGRSGRYSRGWGLQDGGRARVEAEAVAALLVGDKQDDIGAGVGHGSASLGW